MTGFCVECTEQCTEQWKQGEKLGACCIHSGRDKGYLDLRGERGGGTKTANVESREDGREVSN